MIGGNSHEKAYLAPFLIFLAFLLLAQAIGRVGDGFANKFLAAPEHLVFPVQTLVCGVLLWRWRREYTFSPWQGWGTAFFVGVLALLVWIAPQWLFHAAPRTDGFNPEYFGADGPVYGGVLGMRLLRMIVIVPLVEEIFWRGWLLRYLVNDDFQKVPFGTFTWKSFSITCAGFCLEHQMSDWPAALVTGVLFNLVAYRTKSLAACVFAHAVTNAILAWYILHTRQWGFW